MASMPLDRLLPQVMACDACENLPLGPKPLVRVSATARLLVASQAPGRRAHDAGLTFDDPSGDRLRAWLGLDRAKFYDQSRVAFMPMGFCYPGTVTRGGDLPPRSECAPLWRQRLLAAMPQVALILLVGAHAQAWHLGAGRRESLTATVRAWRDYLPGALPLPHPSWRNNGWLKDHPWFSDELLPELRRRVAALTA